jgi:hypothetical protein
MQHFSAIQEQRTRQSSGGERRPVGAGSMPIYTIGRSHLLEILHSELQSDLVRTVDDPMSRRAYEQLMNLGTEFRDTVVYKCLPGQHDDLGISCAMLAWAARHPHLSSWTRALEPPRRRTRQPWLALLPDHASPASCRSHARIMGEHAPNIQVIAFT